MRILRLLYLIFSIIACAVVMAYQIVYGRTVYGVIIIVLVMIPNYYLRNNERNRTARIIFDYSASCDPSLYLEDLKKYRKHYLMSKKQKKIFDLYHCMGYIDSGDFDKSLAILMDIDDSKLGFDDITNILIMKNWCEYFYFNNQNVKMKAALLRLKDFITNSSNDIKQGSSIMYHALEAKYYILVGENLDKARELYAEAINMAPSRLNVTRGLYELALIDIKENNYKEALDKLTRVSKENDNLYVVRRAKELIEMYNNK